MSDPDSKDKFVTHEELDYIMESYEYNMKSYVSTSLAELKTEFIQLFNKIIDNNKEDIKLVTGLLNSMKDEINTFKTLLILSLLGIIFTQIFDKII